MWELFGESDNPFRLVSAVRSIRSGGLEVFGLAEDGSVWQNVSTTPSIDGWTGWSQFGRRRRIPDRSNPGLVSLGTNWGLDGRLRVFGVASDGSSWMNAQTWGFDGWGRWLRFGRIANWRWRLGVIPDGWVRFGDHSEELREVIVPGFGVGPINAVFGLGIDDTVWINILDQYRPERWRGWQEFGEGWLRLSSLVLGRPDDSTIEVIGIRSDDNTIWRNSTHRWELDQWSGWQPFGAPADQFRAVATLRTGVLDGAEADVFALALDDTIWRRAPGSNTWVPFGAPTDRLSTITPIPNHGGWAGEVAGTGPDYSTWYAAMLPADQWGFPSGQWGTPEPFGSPSDGLRQLSFVEDIHQRKHAFGIDPNGRAWHKSQTTPGTWPPP